jgi:hypothetical protein
MSSLVNRWKEHLSENKMTYGQHWVFAVGHGLGCIRAGIYLCIHGMLPCFYRHAGSKLVHILEKDFVDHEEEIKNDLKTTNTKKN